MRARAETKPGIPQPGPVLWKKLLEWMPEVLLFGVATIAGFWARARWIDPVGDPGIWWSTIYRLANGEKLYRDVYLQFGPLSPYLLSLGVRLFGASVQYFLLVTWVPAIGAAVLLLRASKPALNLMERFAVVGLLLSESLFVSGPGRLVFAYAPAAVHALLLSVLALILGTQSDRRPKLYLAGFLAGLAFCSKQEIGLACLLALGSSFLFRPGGIGQATRTIAGFLVASLIGVAAVLSSASLDSLREHSRLWPLAFSPPTVWSHLYRWVAGLSVADWKTVLAQSTWWLLWYIALSSFLGLLLGRERNPFRWLPTTALITLICLWWGIEGFTSRGSFRPTALSMLVAVISVFLALPRRNLAPRTSMLAFTVFAALAGARAAFSTERAGPYSGIAHFATAFTWVLFLCILVPKIVPGGDKAAAWTGRAWAIAILAVSWIGTVAGVASLAEPSKEIVQTPQGQITVASDLAPLFRAIGANLRQGETLWVLPEINGVDAIFKARNVSPYVSHLPGWLDESAELELLRRVETHPPDVVIIFSRTVREYGVRGFGEGYDRLLAKWVDRNYSVVEAMPAGQILRLSGMKARQTQKLKTP